MLFEIEVSGRTRQVTVERFRDDSRLFRVVVDECERLVDAAALGEGQWSLLVGAPEPRASTVRIAETADGSLSVDVSGRLVVATIDGARSRRSGEAASAAGRQTIVAPMPGKVLRVLVEPGQAVAARQALVVVEAMKMENEMTAARDGHVTDVLVTAGQSVEAGRVLVVID